MDLLIRTVQSIDITDPSTIIFLSFLLLCVYYKDRAIGTSARADLYSPPGWPLIGNLPEIVINAHRQLENFMIIKAEREAERDFRNISFTLPFLRLVEVTDPSCIEHIQKTNSDNYIKGALFNRNMSQILGNGIFVVDGDAWRVARKATAKIFTGTLFRTVIASSIETDLAKLRNILKLHSETGTPLDIAALFFAFTLSSFARFSFSVDVGSLTDVGAVQVPFALAFDLAQNVMSTRFNNPAWPITEIFTGTASKMKIAEKELDEFVYKILDEREATVGSDFNADSKDLAGKTDLLSLYMALRDENTGLPMDRKTLRDSVLNLIIAGRDTTAQALAWTFFHLLTQPEIVQDIRKEVDSLGSVDYDTYKNFSTTVATLQEGLRLHPSVPKNGHQVLKDDFLPNGTKLCKGEIAVWSDWRMGRNQEIWGKDAGLFRPSRWIDEKNQVIKESQFKFHAFNGGARLCLGQNLAIYESVSVIATIIKEFDLSFAPNYLNSVGLIDVPGDVEKTPRYQESLTLPMLGPFMVTVAKRVK